jgi:uncharacterized lipoprotein YmbA
MNTAQSRRLPWQTLWPVLLAGLLGACSLPEPQADRVRHFTITSPQGAPAVPDGTRVPSVQVAGHLRDRAIAVRIGENEVIYLEDIVWAEHLADGITQNLRNRLAAIPSNATVSVQIQRCELDRSAGNSVELVASYTILLPAGEKPVVGLFHSTPRKWEGQDHAALVAQLKAAVHELADHLAERIGPKVKPI